MSRRRPDSRKARGDSSTTASGPPPSWSYRIGRLLQFCALLILPFGISSELVGKVGLGQSLLIGAGGALVFYIGYVIQHRGAQDGTI